jgi:membrane-associated phospholipid phosphatase
VTTPPRHQARASTHEARATISLRRILTLGAIAILGVAAVAALGLGVSRLGLLSGFDRSVSQGMNELHIGMLGGLATGIYSVLSPVPAVVITAVITAVILAATRRIRTAMTFAVVVAVTWLPSAGMKFLIHRARPDVTTLAHPFARQPVDGSFPSGHMVFVVAVVVAFAFLARPGAWRAFTLIAGAVVAVIVGLALIVDGVHYATDVIASVLWSVTVGPLVFALCARFILQRGMPRAT